MVNFSTFTLTVQPIFQTLKSYFTCGYPYTCPTHVLSFSQQANRKLLNQMVKVRKQVFSLFCATSNFFGYTSLNPSIVQTVKSYFMCEYLYICPRPVPSFSQYTELEVTQPEGQILQTRFSLLCATSDFFLSCFSNPPIVQTVKNYYTRK